MTHAYAVTLAEEEDGPEPALRERFAVIVARRFTQLEEQAGTYPRAGDTFDFLDAFEGPYVWEMTDEQFEATPPTLVAFEVLSVEPEEPTGSGAVEVAVRIPF